MEGIQQSQRREETATELAEKVTTQRIADAEARGRRQQFVDDRLDSHEIRLAAINGSIERSAEAKQALAGEVRNLTDAVREVKTKVETADKVGHALADQATKAIETATTESVTKRELWLAVATTCAVLTAAAIGPLVAHVLGG